MKCLNSALRANVLVLTIISACPFGAAQSVVWEGELDSHDTSFNRASEDGDKVSFIGTNVYYDTMPFYVSLDGKYTFECFQPEGWDGMIFVYNTTFDPSKPLKNWCYGNDGYEGDFSVLDGHSDEEVYGSRIEDMSLKAGVQYYAVTTSFYNYSTGEYNDGIGDGPGRVTLGVVPEPVVAVPFVLGLASLRRRRKSR